MSRMVDEVLAAAAQAGPMWQDLAIVEVLSVLAAQQKQDITMERHTQDGFLRIKVRVK